MRYCRPVLAGQGRAAHRCRYCTRSDADLPISQCWQAGRQRFFFLLGNRIHVRRRRLILPPPPPPCQTSSPPGTIRPSAWKKPQAEHDVLGAWRRSQPESNGQVSFHSVPTTTLPGPCSKLLAGSLVASGNGKSSERHKPWFCASCDSLRDAPTRPSSFGCDECPAAVTDRRRASCGWTPWRGADSVDDERCSSARPAGDGITHWGRALRGHGA